MSSDTAADMDIRFAEAFNSGKMDLILAMYEPEASLVGPSSGQAATGLRAIRERFERLLAGNSRMTIETKYCIQVRDLALLSAKWHLRGTGADGNPIDVQGKSVEVVRRQSDGRWLYLIDHPFGAD
jgi:ketosteroid isomerase-like protein